MKCPVCNNYNNDTAKVCMVCNSELPSEIVANEITKPNTSIDEPNVEKAKLIVGDNYNYYKAQFERMKTLDSSFSFAAFFFGGAWLAYRKMRKEALLLIVGYSLLALVVGSIVQDIKIIKIMSLMVWVVTSIVLGFIGNKLYFKRYSTMMNQYKNWPIEEMKNDRIFIKKRCGTSWGNVFEFYAVLIFCNFVVRIIYVMVHSK